MPFLYYRLFGYQGITPNFCEGTVPSNSLNDHLVCLCPELFAWQQSHGNDCKWVPGTPSSGSHSWTPQPNQELLVCVVFCPICKPLNLTWRLVPCKKHRHTFIFNSKKIQWLGIWEATKYFPTPSCQRSWKSFAFEVWPWWPLALGDLIWESTP